MAAKLKKRALAEYRSQIVHEDEDNVPAKRLKLGSGPRTSTTSSFGASRSLSLCSEREEPTVASSISASMAKIKAVESAARSGKDFSSLVSQLAPMISDGDLDRRDVVEAADVLNESLRRESEDPDVRAQIYDCLRSLVDVHFRPATDDAKLHPLSSSMVKRAGQWVNHLRTETSDVVKSAILQLLAIW